MLIYEIISVSISFTWTSTLVIYVAESISVQTFRVAPRVLLRIISETVNVARTRLGVFQTNGFQGSVFQQGYEIAMVRGLGKFINESVSVSEGFRKAVSRIFAETIQVTEAKNFTRELIRHLGESVSVQTFRLRSRGLIRLVTESVSIATSFVRLQTLRKLVAESVSVQTFRLRAVSYKHLTLPTIYSV